MLGQSIVVSSSPLGESRVMPFAQAERRQTFTEPELIGRSAKKSRCLVAVLDEIDYGILLLDEDSRVMHANHTARTELDSEHPLQMPGDQLQARGSHEKAMFAGAVRSAVQRGHRTLLPLGHGAQRVSISVVPLLHQEMDESRTILVMLGKRQVCEPLSIQGFGRSHGLTTAESRVLAALCRGSRPNEIAEQLGVSISTVRTQIVAIRVKTGSQSIRALVQQVAVLPPLMSVLRSAAALGGYAAV